jgi:DNA polymerase-4
MPIARALRLCPDAMCVPVPRKACSEKSAEIRAVLAQFSPVVEGASIDEWYMDFAGTEGIYGNEPLARTGHRMRDAVHKATGLTVSIGGGTKLVAKLAVERAKPKPGTGANGVHRAPGPSSSSCGSSLADIPGIGPKSTARLADAGLRTVEDVLARCGGALATRRRATPRGCRNAYGASMRQRSPIVRSRRASVGTRRSTRTHDDVLLEGELGESTRQQQIFAATRCRRAFW